MDSMNMLLQDAYRSYQTLDAGQKSEIISKIEKIRSLICFERLDLLICLDEASYSAAPEAQQALLVTRQSCLGS